ncbi:MarR family transcriptional regulator [Amycolatopsis acidiphila]|uniref:MarR family transcriptional regulator n=1 Tax=Amycolatopsis acidiphila TaxID=715473 RepID=A0A558AID0_9PSEU|nr:MarR family transcriptional regulator [Amycolatopsis acidiphila]TVT24022.1 MarR family transcriptional regulator [Amycolatopsis acidiphila]UIJ57833.1 MarR family transcriptional regulator [Amycolatopsis acidiphila]GHG87948.1 MarR family transcriptional regulator [Amycolatopsis acidiphila]
MADEIDVEATAAELRRAVGQVKRRMRNSRSSDLSAPESSVLSRLDRNGPDNITGLARWDQVTPQTMGATVAALEARGFIERHPDPDDGRRFLLSLTPTGASQLHDIRDAATNNIAAALKAHLSPEEIRLIHDAAPLIERVAQYL